MAAAGTARKRTKGQTPATIVTYESGSRGYGPADERRSSAMKRLFITLVLALVVLAAASAPIFADVVMSNDFLEKNKDKTEPMNHSFSANGADGFVSSREAPGSKKELDRYENGAIIRIGSIYKHKGEYWGISPIGHWYWNPGWMPMNELLMYYESSDFEAEFQEGLYDYSGNFRSLAAAKEFYIWQWPGSDREKNHYDNSNKYFDASDVRALNAWKDEGGGEWVYITIWGGPGGGLQPAGAAAGWVYMSDPNNGDIPAFNPAPDPVPWVYGEAPDWYGTKPKPDITPPGPPARTDMSFIIRIIIVAALAAATFVLILRRLKQKKV